MSYENRNPEGTGIGGGDSDPEEPGQRRRGHQNGRPQGSSVVPDPSDLLKIHATERPRGGSQKATEGSFDGDIGIDHLNNNIGGDVFDAKHSKIPKGEKGRFSLD